MKRRRETVEQGERAHVYLPYGLDDSSAMFDLDAHPTLILLTTETCHQEGAETLPAQDPPFMSSLFSGTRLLYS